MSVPWTERYRPKTLDDLIVTPELDQQIRYIAKHGSNVPHLMFQGLPGLGKTSTAHVLSRYWYPDDHDRKLMTLELNASHERGIQMIRSVVLPFFYRQVSPTSKTGFTKKILILDEADELTIDAQTALRCALEECEKTTLVIFICNYVQRFIPAILSRTFSLSFSRINNDLLQVHLKRILVQEQQQQHGCLAPVIQKFLSQDCNEFWSEFLYHCNMNDIRDCIKQLQAVIESIYLWDPELKHPVLETYVQQCTYLHRSPPKSLLSTWLEKGLSAQEICHHIESQGYWATLWIEVIFHWVFQHESRLGLRFSVCVVQIYQAYEHILLGVDPWIAIFPILHTIIEKKE